MNFINFVSLSILYSITHDLDMDWNEDVMH